MYKLHVERKSFSFYQQEHLPVVIDFSFYFYILFGFENALNKIQYVLSFSGEQTLIHIKKTTT